MLMVKISILAVIVCVLSFHTGCTVGTPQDTSDLSDNSAADLRENDTDKNTTQPQVTVQTWEIVEETGQKAILTVDTNGNFTGSGWVGSTPSGSYDIPITDGRMSSTSMTFLTGATYDGKQGQISGNGSGTLNASFPHANSANGVWFGTISDPLGTRGFELSWTAQRISERDELVPQSDFDFDVDLSPHVLRIKQGEEADISVTVKLVRGEPQPVVLTVTDWRSAGIITTLTPSIVSPTATATLNIKTSCSTPPSDYLFTVSGEGQGTFRTSVDSVTLTIEVNPNCAELLSPTEIPLKPTSLLATDIEYYCLYTVFDDWGFDFTVLYQEYSNQAETNNWSVFWIGSVDDESKRVTFDSVGDQWRPRTIP